MKARLANLKVVIGLSKEGLRKLNKDIRDTRGKFRRNFGEIAGMAKNAALAITGTLVAGIGALIKKGAEMETLRTGFISIAGGANKAAAIVKELNDFTATTPFQLEQVSVAARQLLAVGTKRSELQKELRMLGDIAASSGNSIEDIAAIFSKVKAKGKVELENLNQLAERGIPIFDQLRLVTGDANMEFGAGAVSVEEFNTALANMTAEGGLAAGAMENLSKTVEGRISTLLDNVGLELAGFAEKTGVTDAFGNLLEETTEALKGVSGVTQTDLAAALGKAEEAMEAFGTVTTDNVDEVETAMLAAQDAIRDVAKSAGAGFQQRGLFAMFTGGTKGLKKSIEAQADAMVPLNKMLQELETASASLNEQIMDGTVAQAEEVEVVEEVVEAKKEEKKAKEELVVVERSHMQALGKVKELQSETAVNTLAAVYNNHALKGSLQEVATAVKLPADAMVELGNYAATQLPGFFNAAFSALKEGTGSFKEFMLDALERMLIKLAAMLAAFAALSVLFPGSKAVSGGVGKFLAGGFGIQGFAAGGLVTGPTLGLIGEGPGTSLSNPEVIAPLDKLQQMMGGGHVTVTGMIRGSDILISNERATLDRNRVRGF
jgi:hypothetical protein